MNARQSSLILLGALLAAGCASTDPRSPVDSVVYRNEPLVKDVRTGMTRDEVLRIGGPPSRATPNAGRTGQCHDYVLYHDGKQEPFVVAFDGNDPVYRRGFHSCTGAAGRR